MLQLLILVGRALALGLRGHRELVLENLTLRQQLIAMKRANNRPRLQARVRNHAHAIVACDFFTTVRVGFRVLYVFVVLEVGTRRIVHWSVTAHPTGAWTIQQFRAVITRDVHRFVLHDRDSVVSAPVDQAIGSMGRHVLKTPARMPQANPFCERLIGTIHRECLDWLIPLRSPSPMGAP